MFDIGWSELMVIGVVALIVVGPRDLPQALHAVGKWMRRARMMTREFQSTVDEMMRQADLDELRRDVEKARNFDIKEKITQAIDPDGGLRKIGRIEDSLEPLDLPPFNPRPAESAAISDISDPKHETSVSPKPVDDPAPAPIVAPLPKSSVPDSSPLPMPALELTPTPDPAVRPS